MDMDSERGNSAEALSIGVDASVHDIIDIPKHVTRTEPLPSSRKPTHTYVNGSVPSHLRRRIKRKTRIAARRGRAELEMVKAEGRCKSPSAVHGAEFCLQMPSTAVGTSEYVSAMESLSALSSTEFEVAPTSGGEHGPSYVVSTRIARMMEQRRGYEGSAVEWEIEASRVHWTEEGTATSDDDDENGESDLEVFRSLQQKWGGFFWEVGDLLEVGEKIAEGGQAEIFNAVWNFNGGKSECVVKVFKEGWALRNLQKQWPLGMLQNGRVGGAYYTGYSCLIYGGLLLKNGRFAFWMQKYWGDLRKLIDMRMQHNGNRLPPFKDEEVGSILLEIAIGMEGLHNDQIIHRDLKAANVLIRSYFVGDEFDVMKDEIHCVVADYECSVGVVGTGYWRAPEILHAIQTRNIKPHLFNEKADVYSYAMTCYEVLTGCIPFEDLSAMDYNIVIGGRRPKLPSHVDSRMITLLSRCWHANPLSRPCFKNIVLELREYFVECVEYYECGDEVEVGEKIAEGGQVEIFNVVLTSEITGRKDECVVNVFNKGWACRNLQKQWPLSMLQNITDGGGYLTCNSCLIFDGLSLMNEQFAIRTEKCWGNLRKLIDMRMQHNGNRLPPFKDEEVGSILLEIAIGMEGLHEDKIILRDLKATNVFIQNDFLVDKFDPMKGEIHCAIAHYECSVGVFGTGYWRAPEILHAIQTRNIKPHLFNEKADVYSYAMTCYEVLTGCMPFEDLSAMNYNIVIGGRRPKLPSHVDSRMKTLLSRCWHANPLDRPCFKNIVLELKECFAYR